MYSNNRDAYRQAYFMTWQKYQKKLPLEALEKQLVAIILMHPEYHALLAKPSDYQSQEFMTEENPFLHMSLHLSLHEQLQTNRPPGITEVYEKLLERHENEHELLHKMMDCLGRVMWEAQRTGVMPTEEDYLAQLKTL